MNVTWITEAGLLFESGGVKIAVDPYLSSSQEEVCPDKKRRIPLDPTFLDIAPDVILITHEHPGHLDRETLSHYLSAKKPVTVLAPANAYKELITFGGAHNYVLLSAHSVWSHEHLTFYAVHAEHGDRRAVGFIIDDGKRTFYLSGDTLYNYDVIDDVLDLAPDGVDFAFLPINGRGNTMNAKDAADFAYEIGAKAAIPIHYGLFDDIDPKSFDFEDAIILEPYKKTKL